MSCPEHSTGLPDVNLPADTVYGPDKGGVGLVRFLNVDSGKGLKKGARNQRESLREETAIQR
jgi:hypothetical protein